MTRISTISVLLSLAAASAPAGAGDLRQLLTGTGVGRAVAETLTPSEIAALRFNRGSDRDQHQRILPRRDPVRVDPARHARLIVAAGLTPAEAAGLTLAELAAIKLGAGPRPDGAGALARAGVQLIAADGLGVRLGPRGAAPGLIPGRSEP